MIDHAQAQKYILNDVDGILGPAERIQLDEHLTSCNTCRAEQTALLAFDAKLRRRLHAQWDSAPTPPTAYPQLRAAHRRNHMNQTLRNSLLGFATLTTLLALFVIIIPQMQKMAELASPTTLPADSTSTALPTAVGLPRPEPASRFVAYATSESGNFEIYLARTDGGTAVNITNHPAYDSNPVWSQDGRKIAFESERDGNREIYVMDFDGSNLIRLTNDPANDTLSAQQSWSPDGLRILYKNDRNGKWDLFAANIDGNGATQLTRAQDSALEFYYWSPDGQQVAYVTGWAQNKAQVQIVRANGADRRGIPPLDAPYDFNFVGWAGDGQSFYLSASTCSGGMDACLPLVTRLYQIRVDVPAPEPLVVASGPSEVLYWRVAPGKITYLANERVFMSTTKQGYDHWNWWQVIDEKTSRLNDWPNLQEKCTRAKLDNLLISASGYSEQSNEMVVAVHCGQDELSWLYLVNADGSNITPLNEKGLLGRVEQPRLSADGRVLLYELHYQMKLVGSFALDVSAAAYDLAAAPVRVTATQAQVQPVLLGDVVRLNLAPGVTATPTGLNPAPFPQTGLLAFVRAEDPQSALFVMQAEGSGQRRLTSVQSGSIFNPQWSPDGKEILFEGWVGSEGGLYLAGLDGSLRLLAGESWNAAWSPDGSRIALTTREEELRVLGRDGVQVASASFLSFTRAQDYPLTTALRWRPDGGAVQVMQAEVCGSYPLCSGDRWWIYEMDALTGEVRVAVESKLPILTWYGDVTIVYDEKSWQWQRAGRVVSTATPERCATLEYGPNNLGAVWSPDGLWALFTVSCAGQGKVDLYVARADGSELRRVAADLRLDWWRPIGWSTDGRYIVFSADLDSPGNDDIYLLDVRTLNAQPVRLTSSGFNEASPAWQP